MARLIDGDALLETIEDHVTTVSCCPTVDWSMGKTQMKKQVIEDIRNAPTIGGWISVKDRLPEEHADEHPYEFEQFLCSTVWDDVRMVGFGTRIGDDKPHFWSGNSIWDDWVTHWMPKPKPAKEELQCQIPTP